jgi:hypothetical protein
MGKGRGAVKFASAPERVSAWLGSEKISNEEWLFVGHWHEMRVITG